VSLNADLPELVALDCGGEGIRIPPGDTVPLTPRVRALLDTPPLRRLAGISQLGLVSLVYPGAVHNRLEHSLGVYRLALEFLRRLGRDPRFGSVVTTADAGAFVAAALLHDVGHWAYCHPLEDMGLPEIPKHESLIGGILGTGAVADVLRGQWAIEPARVAALVAGTADDPAARILGSLLSGPIDVDKMDYLARDSLHAGVPYGRHFDQDRLLASLCLDEAGEGLAIGDKGRTAAELMVFARYVMFSEVYWHHAVRAATAMLQRAVWLARSALDPAAVVRCDDRGFVERLARCPARSRAVWFHPPALQTGRDVRRPPCTRRAPIARRPQLCRDGPGFHPPGRGGLRQARPPDCSADLDRRRPTSRTRGGVSAPGSGSLGSPSGPGLALARRPFAGGQKPGPGTVRQPGQTGANLRPGRRRPATGSLP